MTTLKSNLLKKGKKGFTLTELAIVIAVIAILIAVLVPTFTSVITNARKTTAAENAKNAITSYSIETLDAIPDDSIVKSTDGYYFVVNGSTVSTSTEDTDYYTSEPSDLANMVAYVWDTNGENADSEIIIYVTYSHASSVVSSVSGYAASVAEYAAEVYAGEAFLSSTATVYVKVSSSYYFTVAITVSGSSPYTYSAKATALTEAPTSGYSTTAHTWSNTTTYANVSVYAAS